MNPDLGVIEGFFGQPYRWEERRQLVDALAPHGFAFYLYAPKADSRLRRDWAKPYPADQLASIQAFSDHCRASGVRFGIGLSPFELHREDGDGWKAPMAAKIDQLAAIGLDDLAILFDDMRGDLPDLARRQIAITQFVADRAAASRILCCPSYYSDDPILDLAFGQRPPDYLEELGAGLDPDIRIMWTGEEVVSQEISPAHLERIGRQIGRRPFLWDNYPVNDGARMCLHLHLRAFAGRPASNAPWMSGHGINLASQPILSLIPALTLAESYALGDGYQYGAAFVRAADTVLGPRLASLVRNDLLALQDRGLDRLGDRRLRLRDRYAAEDHPAAEEIVKWLDGFWTVDDKLVQTQ